MCDFLPVNPPIGRALAFIAIQGDRNASGVVNTEAHVVAMAEVELRQIAMKMALAAMLIDAFHPAIEDREVAFDVGGIGIVPHIFIGVVLDALMLGELAAASGIKDSLIGQQVALATDIAAHKGAMFSTVAHSGPVDK